MTCRQARFALVTALAIVVALSAPPAQAVPSQVEIFDGFERLVSWLETTYGLVPLDPVTRIEGQTYYRCYTSGICLAAGTDGDLYFYDGTVLSRVGPLSDVVALTPRIAVRLIGTLEGALAEGLAVYIQPVSDGADPRVPVLVGAGELTADDQRTLVAAFQAGTPVAILDATADEIQHPRALLQLPEGTELPSGATALEV